MLWFRHSSEVPKWKGDGDGTEGRLFQTVCIACQNHFGGKNAASLHRAAGLPNNKSDEKKDLPAMALSDSLLLCSRCRLRCSAVDNRLGGLANRTLGGNLGVNLGLAGLLA